jgi:hypothetical protein
LAPTCADVAPNPSRNMDVAKSTDKMENTNINKTSNNVQFDSPGNNTTNARTDAAHVLGRIVDIFA